MVLFFCFQKRTAAMTRVDFQAPQRTHLYHLRTKHFHKVPPQPTPAKEALNYWDPPAESVNMANGSPKASPSAVSFPIIYYVPNYRMLFI